MFVGKVLEGKLHALGLNSYRSISEMGPEDFERAAELIPNLESRMERHKWAQQARALYREKYNESI